MANPNDPTADAASASPAARYPIKTFGDFVRLYSKLPSDRAELMLTESMDAIRYGAATFDLVGVEIIGETFIWIDDDVATGEITVVTTDGETVASMNVNLADGGEAVRSQTSDDASGMNSQ